MAREGTFLRVFLDRVQSCGDREAVFFDSEANSEVLRYGDLDREARRIAVGLRDRVRPGGRVLLLYPSGPQFVTAFLGCVYAGAVPVPAPIPGENKGQLARVDGIVRSAAVSAVLTTGANLDEVTGWARGALHPDLVCESTEDDRVGDAADWREPVLRPDDLAFLQYTSGSTSDPKGVVVPHSALLHNLAWMKRAFGLADGDRCGGWVPFYHDMGLISTLLLPLYLGGSAAFISATAFLRKPYRWLELIDRRDLRYSAGPDFAYDRCVRRVPEEQVGTLDLSRWRTAIDGAEPVRATTLRAFERHFAAAGLRAQTLAAGYGLAEATLCVTCTPPESAPTVLRVDPALLEQDRLVEASDGRELVSCGPVPAEFELRIVDPDTADVLPDGRIGEIWLRGESVAAGYWGLPEESAATFGAKTSDGGGPFLRTGDLGVVHGGELFVCGRIKELLIVHGRNVYPQDIEQDVRSAHPVLADGTGVAFDLDDDAIVVVHEVKDRRCDETALREVAAAVRSRLAGSQGIRVGNVVFVRPGGVRRGTSGKVRRLLMRELFAAGLLEPVFEELDPEVRDRYRSSGGGSEVSPERILLSLLDHLATLVGMSGQEKEELRSKLPGLRLDALGVNSLTAVRLRYHVLRDWGVGLMPQQLIGGPTVAEVVDLIHQQALLVRLTEDAAPADGEVEELTL